MPPIKSYTIKSYDGSTTLFSSTAVGAYTKILTTGITIEDGVEWTYEGDKTFVGVSTVPNASRCEFGIGSTTFFPDNLTVYIYEQDSSVLPCLLSCAWDSTNHMHGTLKLNGVEKPIAANATNYYPIYENDILTWEETAYSTSGSSHRIYYPAINGQIWRNNISLGGEDVVVTGDVLGSNVEEGFSYTVSATYYSSTVGEKNTVWVINDTIPASTASVETVVKFKSNNSEWKEITGYPNVLYFVTNTTESSNTVVYSPTEGWVNEAYRTIEFEQPVWDNELSAWLQANATKQSTPAFTFKHFYDAGTIGTGTVKFRHYSQTEPSASTPKVSIRYDDDYVSGYIAYSLDNGATWSDYITTQTTLLTDVTQIKFKCKGLDGGLVIDKGPYNYNGESGVTTTTISPGYSADTRAYETENITITEDTGFYYYCYYD